MRIITNEQLRASVLEKAPIDEKNVCSDALFDAMFDNGLYTENDNSLNTENSALGFVMEIPTYAHYGGNQLSVSMVPAGQRKGTDIAWAREVICRLTGIGVQQDIGGGDDTLPDYFVAKDDDTNLLCGFILGGDWLLVVFHYDCPRPKD